MKKRLKIWLAVRLGTLLLRVLHMTWRWRFPNREILDRATADGGAIFPFWHNRVLEICTSPIWRGRRTTVVVSHHTDGEIIAQIGQNFGHGMIRGSASRGGKAAMDEMVACVNRGMLVAITPDGPRGPRYRAKVGVAVLAERTRRPVVPFIVAAKDRKKARSWDRFEIPMPFTELTLLFGEPIAATGDVEKTRAAIESAMRDLVVAGDALYGRAPDFPPDEATSEPGAAST